MPLTNFDLQTIRGALLGSPANTIRRHVFNIPGHGAPPASAITQIYMCEATDHNVKIRPGKHLGILSRKFHETDAIRLTANDPNNGIGGLVVPGALNYKENLHFPAHWVATSFVALLGGVIPWYNLNGGPGPSLMVTQRLTGCSFAINAVGAAVNVAHIMPNVPETGAQLRGRIQGMLPGGAVLYGRNIFDYNRSTEVSIIGVRTGIGWEIFAQKMDLLSFKVRSIRRLYP